MPVQGNQLRSQLARPVEVDANVAVQLPGREGLEFAAFDDPSLVPAVVTRTPP